MRVQAVYESKIPFDTARVGAAALYCSDGRYGEQMDEYLHQGCGWPRYDRLAIPGGPAVLSGEISVLWEESFLRKYLEFLVRSHELKHLALIAHDGCGFYRDWLHLPPEKIQQRQLRDLQHARQQLRLNLPGLEVHTLFARKREDRVQFFDVGKTAMAAPALTQDAAQAVNAPRRR
jgi:hypothetical protein